MEKRNYRNGICPACAAIADCNVLCIIAGGRSNRLAKSARRPHVPAGLPAARHALTAGPSAQRELHEIAYSRSATENRLISHQLLSRTNLPVHTCSCLARSYPTFHAVTLKYFQEKLLPAASNRPQSASLADRRTRLTLGFDLYRVDFSADRPG